MALKRNTAVRTVLEEQTAINLALVQVLRLVAAVNNIGGSGRLLQHSKLELSLTSEVDAEGVGDRLEGVLAGGVVDLDLAADM
jgi:hypothetical protein